MYIYIYAKRYCVCIHAQNVCFNAQALIHTQNKSLVVCIYAKRYCVCLNGIVFVSTRKLSRPPPRPRRAASRALKIHQICMYIYIYIYVYIYIYIYIYMCVCLSGGCNGNRVW